jgi:hypothetical protein
MQWPLTSQSHGSFSQRKQLVFHYGSNSTPYWTIFLTCQLCGDFLPAMTTYERGTVAERPTREQEIVGSNPAKVFFGARNSDALNLNIYYLRY